MSKVEVTTKKELKKAMKDKVETIIVSGKLSKKLDNRKKIMKVVKSPWTIISFGIKAIPFAGGLSAVYSRNKVNDMRFVLTLLSIDVILLYAIHKNYTIEISDGKNSLVLKK